MAKSGMIWQGQIGTSDRIKMLTLAICKNIPGPAEIKSPARLSTFFFWVGCLPLTMLSGHLSFHLIAHIFIQFSKNTVLLCLVLYGHTLIGTVRSEARGWVLQSLIALLRRPLVNIFRFVFPSGFSNQLFITIRIQKRKSKADPMTTTPFFSAGY